MNKALCEQGWSDAEHYVAGRRQDLPIISRDNLSCVQKLFIAATKQLSESSKAPRTLRAEIGHRLNLLGDSIEDFIISRQSEAKQAFIETAKTGGSYKRKQRGLVKGNETGLFDT